MELPFVKATIKIRVPLKDEKGKALTCFSQEITTIESMSLWDTGAELTAICVDVIQATPRPEEIHPTVIK